MRWEIPDFPNDAVNTVIIKAPDAGTKLVWVKVNTDAASKEAIEEQKEDMEAADTTTIGFEDNPAEGFTDKAVLALHKVYSAWEPPTSNLGESEVLPKFWP